MTRDNYSFVEVVRRQLEEYIHKGFVSNLIIGGGGGGGGSGPPGPPDSYSTVQISFRDSRRLSGFL